MGEALAPFHEQVVIATKFGFELDPTGERELVGVDSRPEHIKEVAEGSLRLDSDLMEASLGGLTRRPSSCLR